MREKYVKPHRNTTQRDTSDTNLVPQLAKYIVGMQLDELIPQSGR